MNIQTGTNSTCYTTAITNASACQSGSRNDPCYPYVWFMFEAVIPFSAFLAIPQITQTYPVSDSNMYSNSLTVEVYKKLSPSFGMHTPDSEIKLIGPCDPIADPLLNPESDCHNL